MLTILLSVVAVIWITGLVILVMGAHRAPRGYEDARGFHEVREPQEHPAPYQGAPAHLR